MEQPKFCMYLRYYVFSTATGADHLFYIRSTNNETKTLYAKVEGADTVYFKRVDTCGILEWYLKMIYSRTSRPVRSNLQLVTPWEDCQVLKSF